MAKDHSDEVEARSQQPAGCFGFLDDVEPEVATGARRVRPAFAAGSLPPSPIPVSLLKERPLEGRRYIILARQSSTKEGSTSVDDQVVHLRTAGSEAGGECVGIIRLPDTRGSLPGKRQDFKLLRDRKSERDDFDTILCYVPDRWTRAGLLHGFGEEYLLRLVGVHVYFGDGDGIQTGKDDAWGEVKRAWLYSAAKEWLRQHSQRVCGALGRSLVEGRRASRASIPFGCDKLIRSAEGVALYRMRDLRDGRFQKLTADGERVVDTYAKGTAPHKARSDLAEFVPGGVDGEQEAIRRLYDLHFPEKLGSRRAAQRLKEEGKLAIGGSEWTEWRAADLCKSSVYTGKTYAFVGSSAIENEQSFHGPREAAYDRDELYTRSQPKPRWRNPADWLVQEHPAMADFLRPEVRRAAEAEQSAQRSKRYESSRKPKPAHTGGGSKHHGSQYLLSGLLHTTEGDVLTGILCGPKDNQRRAYRVRKSCRETEPRHRLRTQIAAQPLEHALYEALSDALLNYAPDLEERLAEMLADELDQADHTAARLKELQRQREEIRDRVNTIFETYSPAQLKEGQGAVVRLQQQGAELDAQIAQVSAGRQLRGFDPGQVAREMVKQLTDFSSGWPDLPPALAKEAAAALISRAEVDLDTRHVEFELVLPEWKPTDRSKAGKKREKEQKLLIEPPPVKDGAETERHHQPDRRTDVTKAPAGGNGPLCLVAASGMSPSDETQQTSRSSNVSSRTNPRQSMLTRVRCRYRRGGHGRPTSYRCRCTSPLGRQSARTGAKSSQPDSK